MLKKLRTKHLIIVLVIIALAGFLGFRVFEAVESESEMGRGGFGQRVQTVQTDTASRGAINEKIALTGPLRAKEQVDVTPRLTGRIVQLKIDTGQAVRQGALIAVIEDDELGQQVERSKASITVAQAAVTQREAELDLAKDEMDRNNQMLKAGLISRQQFEGLKTRYTVAQSQLDLARAQLRQSEAELRELNIRFEQTRIYSPLTGYVARRHVDVGALVNPSIPIATVVNINTMVIQANASERDIARIRPGSEAAITFDSLPGQEYQGRVLRISPLLDPQTRNGIVEIEIHNRDGRLKGEMFARAELSLGTTHEATLVPRDALVYRGDQPGVYLIEQETARFRPIETGLTQGERVEVISGLQAGEVVITGGANTVKEGDQVKVIDRRAE